MQFCIHNCIPVFIGEFCILYLSINRVIYFRIILTLDYNLEIFSLSIFLVIYMNTSCYKQPHAVFIITQVVEVLVTYFIILVDVYNLIFTKDFKYLLPFERNLYAVIVKSFNFIGCSRIHVFWTLSNKNNLAALFLECLESFISGSAHGFHSRNYDCIIFHFSHFEGTASFLAKVRQNRFCYKIKVYLSKQKPFGYILKVVLQSPSLF